MTFKQPQNRHKLTDNNIPFSSVLKNTTPQQIALLAAVFITGFITGTLVLLQNFVEEVSIPSVYIFIIALCCYVGSYFITIYYLKHYIYRKIKVIYKTIHKHKLSPIEKKEVIDVHSNVFEDVEKEVQEWADNQADEIRQLKSWQEYRRRFLGDISHELKTPIFNIQGYLETLLEGGLEDERINRSYIERASKNVERLITIVEDLRVISSLEDGRLELDEENFDIRKLAQEVFDDMHIKAKEKKLELQFKSGADIGYRVNADREKIRQVLTNLITNSIKYGKEGGSTKIGFYDMDKYILVEVADNGIGISPQNIGKVFERFYRVDKSRSRDQGGTGLGLAIVKHIIEAHKQTINVRSSLSLGSTFGFTLKKA